MEDLKVQVLGVKKWFSDKNDMVSYEVDSILEVREKAVKLSMVSCGRTYTYWCPKSCLEIRNEIKCDTSKYHSLEGKTLDEVIDMYRCNVSFEELVKINRDEFNDYC